MINITDMEISAAQAAGMTAGLRYRLVPPLQNPQGFTGERLGNRPGSSLEFMDHREYMPGDDLRRIDWQAYARSDKLTVRLYREEVDPHVEIILDGSLSMALPGSGKAQAAVAAAAMLAQAATNAHFSHKLWLADEYCRAVSGSSEIPSQWHIPAFAGRASPAESIARPIGRMRPRAMRLFISDLLWPGEPMAAMQALSEHSSCVIVVQVLGRLDIDPPGPGNTRLIDSETGTMVEVYLDSVARNRYIERFKRHQQLWQDACRHCGSVMTTLAADEFLADMQMNDLVAKGVIC